MEVNKMCAKNRSFLRARYSSILAGASAAPEQSELEIQISNLESRNGNEEKAKESQEDQLRLHVYLRMKKVSNWDLYNLLDDKTVMCKVPNSAKIRQGVAFQKMYTFSKIFGPDSVQSDLFDYVKLKIAHFINGYNCSLLTYGASGSGKTYTILGTASDPGIIPRALEHIFRSLPPLPKQPPIKPVMTGGITQLNDSNQKIEKLATQSLLDQFNAFDQYQHTRTYRAMQQQLVEDIVPEVAQNTTDLFLGVWISFAEIYNECIYDLLIPEMVRGQTRQKLRLGQSNGNTYIKDLTLLSVSSGLEAYQILQYGLNNLKFASTSVNYHSSRSHAIFTIKLAQASNMENDAFVSSFNFCDLAGFERAKKTNNVGERLKESNKINASLLVLGKCIQQIRKSQKCKDVRLISFRESKLTQLFQKALLGKEAISMIVNVNPISEMYSETQQALDFSAIIKDVVVEEQEVVKPELENKFVQHLRNSVVSFMEEDEYNYEIEELQAEFVELYDYLKNLQSDARQYHSELKDRYKKIVQDTENYWEERYKDLKEKIEAERVKKHNTSFILIDSSSDEEESFRENYESEVKKLTEEIEKNKVEINKNQNEFKILQERNKNLNETLQDAKDSYLHLNAQFGSETANLCKQICLGNDRIAEDKIIYKDLWEQLKEQLENQEESKGSSYENLNDFERDEVLNNEVF